MAAAGAGERRRRAQAAATAGARAHLPQEWREELYEDVDATFHAEGSEGCEGEIV